MTETVTHFKLTTTRGRAGRLAVMTMDNGHDHRRPNTFGEAGLDSLEQALDRLAGLEDVTGLIITGKPFIFAAGADISRFTGMDEHLARQAGERGHGLFRRVMELPFPTLAAINGLCLGGGLELALHCDVRTVSSSAAALAFPEVGLSIFPAWGGTQLAPRIVGPSAALDTIVVDPLNLNRVMRPAQAAERGFVDRVLDSADFLDASRELLERIVLGEETVVREVDPTDGLDEALAAARRFADERVHGATRAPYVAIDLVEFAARGGDLDEGYRREEDGLAELLPSNQAQAAVYGFDLAQNRVKKQPGRPDAAPRPLRTVGVVGAGLMGAQLASLLLQRLEVPLVVGDVDEGVLATARERIEGDLAGRVGAGRMAPGKAAFLAGLVTYTTGDTAFADADLVIEAVVERLDVKQRLFADLEAVVDPGCVFATNTSSLSVGAMAAPLAHPQRVVGFHVFNPVAMMPLVEVVRPTGASDEAVATAFELAGRLRKSAVACADTPAFVVNRMLTRFNNVGIEAVRRGTPFHDVDDAYKALGLPMGPFELFGLVGLRVAFHTAETLHDAFPDRFPLDPTFAAIADLDVDGVYDWGRGGAVHEAVADLVEVEDGVEAMSAEEIQQAALEAAADEARHLLDDGTVADARDIDTALILGAAFPLFLGGICKHCDQVGVSEKVLGAPLIR